MSYDVAIVGAGIVGLAHALAAVRRGLRVVVIDRDEKAVGASIRNFGFVTVSGQQSGDSRRRAMRSRDVWDEIAGPAGISVIHVGAALVARRPEASILLEAFCRTEAGRDCVLLNAAAAAARFPYLTRDLAAVMFSPHERRVESRDAIPRLAAWLEAAHGVTFLWRTAVQAVETNRLDTTAGRVSARLIVLCPGDDLATLYPERLAGYGVQRSKLQMLRLMPRSPFKLDAAVMADLSLLRYPGYSELPQAAALHQRLQHEQADYLAAGVHLIVVQSADGSLVVGDTHVYGHTLDPFSDQHLDALVLNEFQAVLPGVSYDVTQRWVGTYASLDDRPVLCDSPARDVRLVVVTSGTGASTAFAIGEEIIADMGG
ncbi:MAG: TIGR03364 family FAD-dependent oxidoreductase [Steroidobacteraceae bacterium]